jgi:hypothetical protein
MTTRLFVLAGQSNMLGKTVPGGRTLETASAAEDASVVLSALNWRQEPGVAPGTVLTWSGPGLFFVRGVVAAVPGDVGLVGAAFAGTTLTHWQRGSPYYDAAVAAVKATGLPVAGLLFYQGEADAANLPRTEGLPLRVTNWLTWFERFVSSFRADLGDQRVPVVLCRLAHTDRPDYPNWATIQAQQDAVRLPRCVLVDPEPVTLDDGLHLTDAGYATLGAKMATAWLTI